MITDLSKQIAVTSLNKAIDKSKIYGKLDLKIIHLYELYIYYIEFTEGKEDFKDINKKLKELISELKYKYSDILCNYKLRIPNININLRNSNTAPTVSDNIIDLDGSFVHTFTIEDFTKDFADAEQDSYYNIMIVIDGEVPNNRLYMYNLSNDSVIPMLIPVTNTIILRYDQISNLKFIEPQIRDTIDNINKAETNYNIKFRVSDDYAPNRLYSSLHNLNIINSAYVENEPATIGDISIIADNRAITTLTLAMFTSGMNPPYNDPENDLIDAIRINSISNANKGIFYYDGNPIQVGDIITREEIETGLFTHEGADINTITGDSLDFSARDEGSMQWIE